MTKRLAFLLSIFCIFLSSVAQQHDTRVIPKPTPIPKPTTGRPVPPRSSNSQGGSTSNAATTKSPAVAAAPAPTVPVLDFTNLSCETVNIENDGVKAFMADRTYDQPGNTDRYSLTVVQKYSKGIGSTPRGKSVSWQRRAAEGELADLVVTLSMSENFEGDVNTYYPADNSTSYTICNMLPDSHYYYKVEEVLKDGTRNVVTYGHFITTGQVRMMRVGGMFNVRDFGGWNTSFGVKTKYGCIFRGNHPRGITETGRNDFVKNEHITADLELTGTVRDRSTMGPANEVEIHTTNNARYKTGLTQPSSKAALRDDLKFISRVMQEGGAVFLHCNHGVNRAGTLAFVIGGLIGLSEADLSREYELSSFAYGNTIRAGNYASMLPVIRSYGKSGDSLTQCFYNYCLELGVSEEELDGIRCAMLGLEPEHELIEAAHREK